MPVEREADILVVGAGGAGLCAAVRAAESGASVIVLEKRNVIGGNTIIAGGRINIADTKQQAKHGIEDSQTRHFEDTYRSGDYVANPELVWTLVSKAHDVLAYLEAHGMKFHEDRISAGVGGIWPRGLIPVAPKGTGYIQIFKTAAEKLGVKILLNHKMTSIIREEHLSGRVLGVNVVDANGQALVFMAKKAVIMASGGFAGDAAFRMKHDNRWNENFPTSNYSGCSAEALVAAADAGADQVGMDYIQCNPAAFDLKRRKNTIIITEVIEDMIYVNTDAHRIINSDARRDLLRDAIYKQKDHMAIRFCDERGRRRSGVYGSKCVGDEQIEQALRAESLFIGSTVQELAQNVGIDPNELEKTVFNYNRFVEDKFDPDFHTDPIFLKYKLENPPFYVTYITVKTHFSMGGLRINNKAQVIDRRDKVIPGFYAAGEVTGGVHGSNRVGGNALLEIHVFGMLAADNALNL